VQPFDGPMCGIPDSFKFQVVSAVLVHLRVYANLHDPKNKHGRFDRGNGQYLRYTVMNGQYSRRWANGRHRVLRPGLVHIGPPAGHSQARLVAKQIYR